MAVHKDCYAPIGLIQQGGPRRRETFGSSDVKQLKACWPRSQIEVRESPPCIGLERSIRLARQAYPFRTVAQPNPTQERLNP